MLIWIFSRSKFFSLPSYKIFASLQQEKCKSVFFPLFVYPVVFYCSTWYGTKHYKPQVMREAVESTIMASLLMFSALLKAVWDEKSTHLPRWCLGLSLNEKHLRFWMSGVNYRTWVIVFKASVASSYNETLKHRRYCSFVQDNSFSSNLILFLSLQRHLLKSHYFLCSVLTMTWEKWLRCQVHIWTPLALNTNSCCHATQKYQLFNMKNICCII